MSTSTRPRKAPPPRKEPSSSSSDEIRAFREQIDVLRENNERVSDLRRRIHKIGRDAGMPANASDTGQYPVLVPKP